MINKGNKSEDFKMNLWDKITYPYWSLLRMFKEIIRLRRNIKYTYQIWTKGWCDCDVYDVGDTIAQYAYPRLIRFREKTISFPPEMTYEEWMEKIDKMIYSFGLLANDEFGDWQENVEDMKKFKDGMDLFSKYYLDLWW